MVVDYLAKEGVSRQNLMIDWDGSSIPLVWDLISLCFSGLCLVVFHYISLVLFKLLLMNLVIIQKQKIYVCMYACYVYECV